MIKLIALKDLSPDGSRQIKKDDEFEISDSSAKFLVATKRARYVEPPPEVKKGRYERRDMRAKR